MRSQFKKLIIKSILIISFFLYFCSFSFADNHNIYGTLEQIQKDQRLPLQKQQEQATLAIKQKLETLIEHVY